MGLRGWLPLAFHGKIVGSTRAGSPDYYATWFKVHHSRLSDLVVCSRRRLVGYSSTTDCSNSFGLHASVATDAELQRLRVSETLRRVIVEISISRHLR